MKSFIGWSLRSGLKAAVLLALGCFAVNEGQAQYSFAAPQVLTGDSGSVTNYNVGVIADPGAPAIAGFPANAPLWYEWTASHDGEVELDTVGSDYGLDTVLGVYSGTQVSQLNQIAANDDLYPVNSTLAQITPGFSVVSTYLISPFSDSHYDPYIQLPPQFGSILFPISYHTAAFYGPSHVRFNAKGGQTYYFAVDTKVFGGNVALTWAYESSGVFRFASEDVDPYTGALLYQTGEYESVPPEAAPVDRNSVVGTYYNYNAPGALVTITRAAGSKGRVVAQYTTENGSALPGASLLPTNDVLAYTVYTNIVYFTDTNGLPYTNQLGFTASTNILPGSDYSPVSGTLVFDDFEMSKTILIPINSGGGYLTNPVVTTNVMLQVNGKDTTIQTGQVQKNTLYNAIFGVAITNVSLDPLEAPDVSEPRTDPAFSVAEVKILNNAADPYGPDIIDQVNNYVVSTNTILLGNNSITIDTNPPIAGQPGEAFAYGPTTIILGGTTYQLGKWPISINGSVITFGPYNITNTSGTLPIILYTNILAYGGTNFTLGTTNYSITNQIIDYQATNYLFNFEKANYRVPADVNDPSIAPYNWQTVTLYVERTGTNTGAMTVNYRVNNELADDVSSPEYNDEYPLQPGSDYAIPLPANNGSTIRNEGTNYDFDVAEGTISFPASGAGSIVQPIKITIPVSNQTKFNKDFRIELYREVDVGGQNQPQITGMNSEATVTILFNDENPPAGSVDELYNPDFIADLALLPSSKPAAFENDPQETPGVGSPANPGQVYAICVLSNNEALIGGNFSSYDGAGLSGVALVNTNGLLDTSFNTGTGVSGDLTEQGDVGEVNAVAVSGSQYYIGGNFTSYNGQTSVGIARLNSDGSLDTSFTLNPPPDGVVRAIQVMTNGEVLIGGDFTHVDGVARNYVALLNTDGSVDTTFNPTNILTGPVYALALPVPSVSFSNFTNNSANEADQTVNFGVANAGVLTLNYNNQTFTNDFQVYYGGNNAATPGTGVLVYDTGMVAGTGSFTVPIGPTGGLTTNVITVVVNPGGAAAPTSWSYNGTITFPNSGSGIMVGGNFGVTGQAYNNIARLNNDGSLDTSFSPLTGSDGIVHTLGWQFNGQIVAGGEFTHFNGLNNNYIVRLNYNGSIDTTNWFAGIGADNAVYNVTLQEDGTMYVGGSFQTFNGTRRSGFARLYPNGTVDTTFMDTAYNQFAGIKKIFSDDPMAVFASGVQNNNGVLIGGSFLQIGGGQADTNVCDTLDDDLLLPLYGSYESFTDPNEWVEPKTRDGVRNRIGFARLIAGATPGPGNISLNSTSYSQDKSESSEPVSLVRTNGILGPVSANFTVQPELAQPGQDYQYQAAPPMFWIGWNYISNPSRQREDGLWGVSGSLIDSLGLALPQSDKVINDLSTVSVGVLIDHNNPGNLNAQFQLANPSLADTFYLGGEEIPLGAALGASSAPFTLIDDTTSPGQFGFSSPTFIASSNSVTITMVRSNGTFGQVSMVLNTTNGTALSGAGRDYIGVTNKLEIFNNNVTTVTTNISILDSGYIGTVEKTFTVSLSHLGITPNATFGISNAVVRIVNPNIAGYVTLGASNYTGTISSGSLNFVVNRVVGSGGEVSVGYATVNGSAISGTDYIGGTNTLTWDSGDVSSRTVSIPLIPTGVVGTNKQFSVVLFNPTNALMGAISNAVLTISNDNSYGVIQLTAPSYNVNENGGYATITAMRTGGTAGTVSVNYATSDGTAIQGSNYVATTGVLVFAPSQTVASFNVPVLHDGVIDPVPFYFNVTLSNPTNAVLGSPTNAQVDIFDVDATNQPAGSPDTTFTPAAFNGDVFALALQTNGQILVGGDFTASGSVPAGRLARLNGIDGTLDTSFLNGYAGASAAVNTLVCQTDGRILIGGSFTSVDGANLSYFGRLMTDGSVDTSFNPGAGADSVVNAMAEDFGLSGTNMVRKIYVGGAFGTIEDVPSPGIIRLNNDGSVDNTFSTGSGVDGQIYAIAVYPTNSAFAGKVLIGGSFSQYNGTAITNLARLNADGSLDSTFNPGLGSGPNGAVRALSVQVSGQVLVGGTFSSFNGIAANNLARLNTDGTLDTNFLAAIGSGANNDVQGLLTQPDNRIVVVGEFTEFDGVTRNHITRLMPTGGIDPTINFGTGANGDMDAVVIQPADGKLVVGGAFTEYDGQPYGGVVRIDGGSMTGSGDFTFETGQYYVNENAVVAPITILRTGGTSGTNPDFTGNVTVNFATVGGGSAVPNTNYLMVNTNVVFPEGEVLETVLVPVLDDGVVTPTLTVQMALSNPMPPAGLTNQTTATLNIINVDSAVTLSNAFPTVSKNVPTGVGVINVLRLGGTNDTSSVVFYTTTNGTAVIGTDYYPTNVTLTFSPGQTVAQAYVPIINNGIVEGNRTIDFALTNGINTTFVAPTNGVLTIIDTVSAPGQLYFSATNFTASSGDGNGYLTVLRTNGSTGNISVTYYTVPGTAQPGLNYVSTTGTLTFGNGETMESVAIPVVNNSIAQGPVSLSVVLTNASNGATLTAPSTATLTIANTNVGFAFQAATNSFLETSGTVPIFVQRIGSTSASVQVSYSTVSGTAVNGVNYTAVSGTLNFGVGESLKAISLPLLYDPQVTGNLDLTLKLSSPSMGTVLSSPSNTVVVVEDADAGLSFTNASTSVQKNSGVAVITVVCSNTNVEPVIVNSNTVPLEVQYATENGTAVAGVDYVATQGTLIFTNGIATNTFTVPILNNTLVTGDKTFTVTLSNPTAPGKLIPPSTETVDIVDDNTGFQFSQPTYLVAKNGISATINVLRTGYTNDTAAVNFVATNGTAISPNNFTATNGTLIFTNGVTSQSFAVSVVDTTVAQPDLTVLLQLMSPSNAFLVNPSAATLTIRDYSGSFVEPCGAALVSESGAGAPNGIIDSNETVSVLFGFRDAGGTNVSNLIATLLATNGVTSPSVSQAYGRLVVGSHSVSRQFTFTAHGTNGAIISPTFELSDNGTKPLGTNAFTFTLGNWTTSFTNSAPIIISAGTYASPYPAVINVSGVGGSLIKATATVTNFTASYAADVDMLLVAPSLTNTLLMANAGGFYQIIQATITFDDGASNSLPQSAQIVSGTNKPSAYGTIPNFP